MSAFKFTIDTRLGVNNTNSFRLRLRSGYTGTYTVDWGDGTIETNSGYDIVNPPIHIYSTPNIYTISLTGEIYSYYVNDTNDKEKYISIEQWGDLNFISMLSAFKGCYNLKSVNDNSIFGTNVQHMSQMFMGCNSLETLDVSNWDVSNVINLNEMFAHCHSLETLDVSNWDVSNVINLNEMFAHCHSLETLDVSNWDVSNVKGMESMFGYCHSLKTLDLSNWDTSNVTSMGAMFVDCYLLETLDVSNWDVSNVTSMGVMFTDCHSLKTLDVSNWHTPKLRGMHSMFMYCYNLKQLDFSNWTFPNWSLPNFGSYSPQTFQFFLKDTPLNVTSYTSLLIRLNQTLNLGDKDILESLDANLCKYDCRYANIRNNLFDRIETINDNGCVWIQNYRILNLNINGKQYDTLNLGKWYYQANWTNSFYDTNNSNFNLEFRYNGGDYFELPVDTNTSSKALVGSNILRSDEEYEIRINYNYDVYSNPLKFRTSNIDFPTNINYQSGLNAMTISWMLVDYDYYYNSKVYIQVDGVGEFLINPNSNYLDTTQFNVTGLENRTEYTWRFKIVHSNEYHDTDRTYYSNNYKFITNIPKSLCNSNLNKINPDCGDNNGGLYYPIETGYTLNDYLELFDFSLLVYDLNTNTESVRTDVISTIDGIGFNGLDAGYYHLTITTKPDAWYFYGREECVKEWIKLENNTSTVGVNSVRSKPAICSGFDNQSGRLQVQLDGVSPFYKYWFFDVNGILIKNDTTTNSYIVLNNATECYYGVIEDSNGCRYLMDKVCIPTETSSSISGIKQLFIAPVTGDVDFDYYNTEDDDYYLDGEDNSFFMSTKISRINTVLSWYKIPIHNGQVNFKQTLNKNRQGFIFSDVMEVGIAHQTQEKLNTLLRNLLNKFIVVFQDANGNWWISGYTSHASLDTIILTTGKRYDSNQYTLNITSNSADNIITNINEDWVKNNILN